MSHANLPQAKNNRLDSHRQKHWKNASKNNHCFELQSGNHPQRIPIKSLQFGPEYSAFEQQGSWLHEKLHRRRAGHQGLQIAREFVWKNQEPKLCDLFERKLNQKRVLVTALFETQNGAGKSHCFWKTKAQGFLGMICVHCTFRLRPESSCGANDAIWGWNKTDWPWGTCKGKHQSKLEGHSGRWEPDQCADYWGL